jgi:alkylation response protein AidB-like acyl-CoA dehydrogenase
LSTQANQRVGRPKDHYSRSVNEYRAPVSDIVFALRVAGYDRLTELDAFAHADLETVEGMLEEAGTFVAKVIAPTNRAGDKIGAVRNQDGSITTAPGFKEAYDKLMESGWLTVPYPEEWGGGAFPSTIGFTMQELVQSSNMAFSLGPLLTHGFLDAFLTYASDELKATYVEKMVSGQWMGTMNLTEPQAGTDVGALGTKAVPSGDGSFAISGQKIFITWGEHDLTENIVHLVLARTPGAPEGTKGISLFVVPKFLPDADGEMGERNALECIGVEEKLGIHGSPTCVMSFDGATGWLVGDEHKGMRAMFVMMNAARLSVGMQGLSQSVRAYQQAVDYAKDRVQGRTITGERTIIGHPDVRRMLMTQRATTEALRGLLLLNAVNLDIARHHPDEAVRARGEEVAGLLTPLSKSWGTDLGVENASINIQIHGGHGYIEETGAAQFWRDARISPIYEGTNGVQAADLVSRKLPVRDGASFLEFIDEIETLQPELRAAGYADLADALAAGLANLREVTAWMLRTGAGGDAAAVLAGSVPYLKIWALNVGAWSLAKGVLVSDGDADRVALAEFFARQLLPEGTSLAAAATAGFEQLKAFTF